jgi:site-specific DNA-methyltransferase (adenine-specific)
MQVEMRPIESIRPYPDNPRDNDAAVDAVARSIEAFGWHQPIVVDEQDVIIVGHTRLKAALKLGLREVPVHVAEGLSPEQAKAYRIADNQTATLAQWDDGKLAQELMALQSAGFDLDLTGFSAEDLQRLMDTGTAVGLTDPDDVPDIGDELETRPGDLWLLGNHRLLCGDSTKPEDLARLVGPKPARMVFTDPPWNVAIGQDSNPRHRQRPGLANDDLSPQDFRAFLDAFVAAVTPHLAGDLYCVLGASEWPTLDAALRRHGYHWSATVIWVKDAFVLGRSKYHRRYEPIWYGWHSSGRSSFGPARNLDDVWEVPRPRRSEDHPTTKPVELVRRAVENSSRPGELVLDPFGGSGSTLIACEQAGRRGLLLELEPRYCDVIKRRWEEFTGQRAVRAGAEEGAAA